MTPSRYSLGWIDGGLPWPKSKDCRFDSMIMFCRDSQKDQVSGVALSLDAAAVAEFDDVRLHLALTISHTDPFRESKS